MASGNTVRSFVYILPDVTLEKCLRGQTVTAFSFGASDEYRSAGSIPALVVVGINVKNRKPTQ